MLRRGAKPDSHHAGTGRPVIFRAIELNDPEILTILLHSGADHSSKSGTHGETPFLWAVGQGSLPCVEALAKVADVSAQDEAGQNALSIAIVRGRPDVARTLLRMTENGVGSADDEGLTPLHHAVRAGSDEMVEILLRENGVDPECADKHGLPPLVHGVLCNHSKVVVTLLGVPEVQRRIREGSDGSILCQAVERDHLGLVRSLLDLDWFDPNWQDKEGYSPLHRAVMASEHLPVLDPEFRSPSGGIPSAQVLSLLLDRGVNVNAIDRNGWTALMHACDIKEWEDLEYLGGRNNDHTRGQRVRLLLAAPGIDLNIVSNRERKDLQRAGGGTAFSKAVFSDNWCHMELLMNSDGPISFLSVPNELGMTAAHHLAMCSRWEQWREEPHLKFFNMQNPLTVDLDCRDKLGRTPIFFASLHDEAWKLMSAGASINITDHEGWFPTHYSAVGCPPGTLAKRGNVDINCRGPFGLTPFHMALRMDWLDDNSCWLDLVPGLDVNSKDDFGNSPVDHAAKQAVRVEQVYGCESRCLESCKEMLASLLDHPNLDTMWDGREVDEIIAQWKGLLSDGGESRAEDQIVQQCAERLKELTLYKTLKPLFYEDDYLAL